MRRFLNSSAIRNAGSNAPPACVSPTARSAALQWTTLPCSSLRGWAHFGTAAPTVGATPRRQGPASSQTSKRVATTKEEGELIPRATPRKVQTTGSKVPSTVEDVYVKKTPIEHVLLRPGKHTLHLRPCDTFLLFIVSSCSVDADISHWSCFPRRDVHRLHAAARRAWSVDIFHPRSEVCAL